MSVRVCIGLWANLYTDVSKLKAVNNIIGQCRSLPCTVSWDDETEGWYATFEDEEQAVLFKLTYL